MLLFTFFRLVKTSFRFPLLIDQVYRIFLSKCKMQTGRSFSLAHKNRIITRKKENRLGLVVIFLGHAAGLVAHCYSLFACLFVYVFFCLLYALQVCGPVVVQCLALCSQPQKNKRNAYFQPNLTQPNPIQSNPIQCNPIHPCIHVRRTSVSHSLCLCH